MNLKIFATQARCQINIQKDENRYLRENRFVCHFVPVHCSWMNQVEQWLSVLQRKRLRISDFASLDDLAERLMADVSEWNAQAHPFNWSSKSAAKVMAKCEAQAVRVPVASSPTLFNAVLYSEFLYLHPRWRKQLSREDSPEKLSFP